MHSLGSQFSLVHVFACSIFDANDGNLMPSLYAAMSFKLWRCIRHVKYSVVTMWTDVLTTKLT